MFQKIFSLEKGKLYRLLSVSTVAFAAVFLVVVGVVVYRSMSEAFFQSEQASADSSIPDIKDEDLLKAVNLAEQWKEQERQIAVPTVPVVNKADIVIDVLNSTENTGLVLDIADKLKAAGFTNIREVSDSKEKDIQTTQIQRKPSVSLYEELIIETVGLSSNQVIIGDLSETSEFDMVVLIGQDLSK